MTTSTYSQSRLGDLIPKRWYVHILLWIAVLFIGFPLIYAMIVATQSNAETLSFQFTPGSRFWENLRGVIITRNLLDYMYHSTVLAVVVIAISIPRILSILS